jgi:hypothetical protein
MADRVKRLREIADAIARGDRSELTMRVPAEPDRDADLVVSWAADEIERLCEALRVERHEHHRRTQMTEYPSITANLLWNMDSVRRIDAALSTNSPEVTGSANE